MEKNRTVAAMLGALLASAALVFGAAPGHAQVRVIMSNDNNALGVKGQTFEVLKREIEKRLGDKVKVELHHSGTLFDQATQIQGVQLGSADIIAPAQGIYSSIAPKINALSLPFLIPNAKAARAVMKDPAVRAAIVPDLEKKNITPIAIWINGPRDFAYRGTKPILLPDDIKGVKIRVQPIPVDLKAMQTFGANVVSMTWTEVPTALQQGVIDAVEPVPNALVGAGLQELVDQVTRANWQYSFYIVGANKRWWDALPADARAAINEALEVATEWNIENTAKENEKAYDKVRALGKPIHNMTPEQRAKWVEMVQPIWTEFGEKLVGPQAMSRLREISKENK